MKYFFKQRLISWFDSYDIYDENNEIAFVVKGELSLGHQLRVFDKNNQEIGLLKEKLLTFLPKYYMYDNNGNQIGLIEKELSFLKPKYKLTCNDWKVTGDFWSWNYKVEDLSNEIIMTAQKKLALTDQYCLDVPNEKNSLLCLMIVLAIDIDKERQNSVASSSSTSN